MQSIEHGTSAKDPLRSTDNSQERSRAQKHIRAAVALAFAASGTLLCASAFGDPKMDLYKVPNGMETRWYSFENPTGAKGVAASENQTAKGHAFDSVAPGQTRVLADVKGAGQIRRMWFTVNARDPRMLRSLRFEIFWDGADKPAVSVPFGDFFCAILGKTVAFENEFFANPEGRSFNCYLPMPFKTGAKVTLTNDATLPLEKLFYDIDILQTAKPDPDALYFHATWRRDPLTTLGEDFELLPRVQGKGRFLGVHVGLTAHPDNVGWFGEGEVKMYIDGDGDLPTLAGTGTEDYIGTGWGQGKFHMRYQGCLIADGKPVQYAFYRYHVPDPVYFYKDIRVTLQQMGGASKKQVVELLEKGVEIRPVSIDSDAGFVKLLDANPPIDLLRHDSPDNAWVNMYRRDDVCATSLFYLDAPTNGLPPLAPVDARVAGLPEKTPTDK